MKLGLIAEFDAAHSLPGYSGKCAHMHGHTYQVEMVVEGQVGQDGFVMDFYELKKILGSALQELDHSCLNEILPNPTAGEHSPVDRRAAEKRDGDHVDQALLP